MTSRGDGPDDARDHTQAVRPSVHRRLGQLAADRELVEDLVRVRLSQGLTQHQVANRMGVPHSAISHYELEEFDPTMSFVRRYADAVGVHIRYHVASGTQT